MDLVQGENRICLDVDDIYGLYYVLMRRMKPRGAAFPIIKRSVTL